MTWIAPTPDPVDGPLTGADRRILEGFLAWQRSTLLNICAGLTAEQLASRPLATSNLTLLGLVRHMGKVERVWFRHRAAHDPIGPMYDPALGKDADFDDTLESRDGVMSLRMTYVHMIGEYARHNGHADLLREAIDGVTAR